MGTGFFRTVAFGFGLALGGTADAFMGFAQEPAELRARGVGRVILNTSRDRP